LGPAYNECGIIYSQRGNSDEAIADFTKAIALIGATLEPHSVAGPYYNRGTVYNEKANYERAVIDFDKAISLYPNDPYYYRSRATAYFHTRNYKGEIADLERALQLSPTNSNYNAVAWFLATCPQADLRDGKSAIEHATKACEMTNWKHGDYIDTLSAAYAEAGEFEEAVRREKEAVALPDMKSKQDEAKARVILYQSRTPFREERRDPPKPAPIISSEPR
jgi:tetratricopeptide (TPR) repeat protein